MSPKFDSEAARQLVKNGTKAQIVSVLEEALDELDNDRTHIDTLKKSHRKKADDFQKNLAEKAEELERQRDRHGREKQQLLQQISMLQPVVRRVRVQDAENIMIPVSMQPRHIVKLPDGRTYKLADSGDFLYRID